MRARARPFLAGGVLGIAACGAFTSANDDPTGISGSLDGGVITLADGATILPDGGTIVVGPDGAIATEIPFEVAPVALFDLRSVAMAMEPVNFSDFASAAYDGRFVYTATRGATTGTSFLRYDTTKMFSDARSWGLVDSRSLPSEVRMNGPEFIAYNGDDVLYLRGKAEGSSLAIGSFDLRDDNLRNAFESPGAWDRNVASVPNGVEIGAVAATQDQLVVFKWAASQMYSCKHEDCANETMATLELGVAGGNWKIAGAAILGENVFPAPSGFDAIDAPFLIVPLGAGSVRRFKYPGATIQTTYELRGAAALRDKVYYAPYRVTKNGAGRPLTEFPRITGTSGLVEVMREPSKALDGAGGFAAVVSDRNRFVYFIPSGSVGTEATKSLLVRYDTTLSFTEPAAWKARDLALGPGEQIAAATYDGQALYLFPANSMTARRVQLRGERDPAFQDGNYAP